MRYLIVQMDTILGTLTKERSATMIAVRIILRSNKKKKKVLLFSMGLILRGMEV